MRNTIRFPTLARYKWLRAIVLYALASTCALADTKSEGISLPLPYFEDIITVPVTIGGHEYEFALDTGATHHVFDLSLRKLLGDSVASHVVRDAGGAAISADVFKPPQASLAGTPIQPNEWVTVADLASIRAATGRDIRGLLGMPFFGTYVVQLDFDARQLHILPADTVPKENWGTEVPVVFAENNLPHVKAAVGTEEDEYLVIDIGWSSTLAVRSDTFNRLLEHKAISSISIAKAAVLSGLKGYRAGILTEFELAAVKHQNLRISETAGRSRIGLHYFRRYRATFDLANGKMYLNPGFDINKPEDDRPIGVSVLRREGKTVIQDVDEGSAAQQAGLMANDEIVAVDGNATEAKPIGEIMWLIKKHDPKRPAELILKRDGKELKLQMPISGLSSSH